MAMISTALEDWVWSFRENNYLSAAAFALLYYDYALTFTDEVNHFWKSASLSLFSTLFVFNRYLSLIGTIPVIVEYFVDLPETWYDNFGMLLLRTYALYERSKVVLMLLVITFIGGIAACLTSMLTVNSHSTERATGTVFGRDPPNQCDLSLTTTQAIHFSIGWGAMLWFDITVFVLTLIRALRTHRWLSGGTLEVLFRDGTIYFGIMVVLNVSNIVTFLATPVGSKKGMETTLVNVLSTTLTSRLFLNLRDLGSPRSHHRGDEESSYTQRWGNGVPIVSRLVFATQTGWTDFDVINSRSVND